MKRTLVDVASCAPVDALARRIVRGSERYEPDTRIMTADSGDPLPTMPFPRSGGKNLAGLRFGRMRVIGYSAAKRGRWVVRCSCGIYTLRAPKAICNAANVDDACQRCRHAEYLRHRSALGAGINRENRTKR